MEETRTKEPQYQIQADSLKELGEVKLGCTTSHLWRSDPRHLLFFLSRYKFAAKMLTGYSEVVEIGCGDGFGSKLLVQNGIRVVGIDFDPLFISTAREREKDDSMRSFEVHNFVTEPTQKKFDAAYSLDVIEHIHPNDEDKFLTNVVRSLKPKGIAVFGTPSLESQIYASVWSKAGHINCKSAPDWKKTFTKYFDHVFMFGMNDEVLHTGFHPMCHYIFALCVNPREN